MEKKHIDIEKHLISINLSDCTTTHTRNNVRASIYNCCQLIYN